MVQTLENIGILDPVQKRTITVTFRKFDTQIWPIDKIVLTFKIYYILEINWKHSDDLYGNDKRLEVSPETNCRLPKLLKSP